MARSESAEVADVAVHRAHDLGQRPVVVPEEGRGQPVAAKLLAPGIAGFGDTVGVKCEQVAGLERDFELLQHRIEEIALVETEGQPGSGQELGCGCTMADQEGGLVAGAAEPQHI